MVIHVKVGMAQTLGSRHLPEHGVRSELALPATKAFKQNLEPIHI